MFNYLFSYCFSDLSACVSRLNHMTHAFFLPVISCLWSRLDSTCWHSAIFHWKPHELRLIPWSSAAPCPLTYFNKKPDIPHTHMHTHLTPRKKPERRAHSRNPRNSSRSPCVTQTNPPQQNVKQQQHEKTKQNMRRDSTQESCTNGTAADHDSYEPNTTPKPTKRVVTDAGNKMVHINTDTESQAAHREGWRMKLKVGAWEERGLRRHFYSVLPRKRGASRRCVSVSIHTPT